MRKLGFWTDSDASPIPAAARTAQPKLKTGMQCAACRRSFAARSVTFTDRGPMCAACIAAAGA